MEIRALGYVGLQGPDPKTCFDFATQVCGLAPARCVPGGPRVAEPDEASAFAADGSVFLKMDDWQWRIAAHPDERPGLRYLGLEVANEEALSSAATALERAGQTVETAGDELLAARAVHGMRSVVDPAGNRVELFHGVVGPTRPARSRGRASRSPRPSRPR
jgi:3,4-dihydroxy-9,10-secoandrosta-1,3,5(10)-triene-9,17-dione 4,5-dioxygenase